MKVISWSQFSSGPCLIPESGAAMTIGVFDGVHRGHQALIGRISASVRRNLEPVIISFKQNPKARQPGWAGEIYTLEQKLAIFEDLGAALTILIDFSLNFSKLEGRKFIDLLRDRGSLRYLVIGSDFRCGHNLDTDAEAIAAMNRENGIETEVVCPVLEAGRAVSSSRIRAAVAAGRLEEAERLLGRKPEIDLSGLAFHVEQGGVFLDLLSPVSAQKAEPLRIVPPEGLYPVLLYEKGSAAAVKTELIIREGGVFIPFPCSPSRVVFVI